MFIELPIAKGASAVGATREGDHADMPLLRSLGRLIIGRFYKHVSPTALRTFALLLGAMTFTLRAAELPPAEAASLLEKLQQHRAKFPALTSDFTEEKTTHLLNKPMTGTGTLAFQAPNKFRRELKGKNPSLTVSNGEKLWIYYPNFKEAELYTMGQRQVFDDSIAALMLL